MVATDNTITHATGIEYKLPIVNDMAVLGTQVDINTVANAATPNMPMGELKSISDAKRLIPSIPRTPPIVTAASTNSTGGTILRSGHRGDDMRISGHPKWLNHPARRYARWGLFRNPFTPIPDHDIATAEVTAVVDIEAIVSFLIQPRTAVQILGHAGSGKSTHLNAVASRLSVPTTYVPPWTGAPEPIRRWFGSPHIRDLVIPGGSVVAIDEAQRLPRRIRYAVMRTAPRLIFATHRNLRRSLAAFDFSIRTIRATDRFGGIDAVEQIGELLHRRIAAAIDPGDGPGVAAENRRRAAIFQSRFDSAKCRQLHRRYRTRIRSLMDDLYEATERELDSDQAVQP